ncbi:MAG: polysaccharide deacetylase family protein, partial [Nitrosopumilaceae archaeon]|nr:polysaccharide deacetylase family protein [Nitrosopumilaceae archaeon]
MKTILFLLSLIFISSISAVYAEQEIEIELLYPTGDRATINNAVLLIESVDGTIHKELTGNASQHSFFATLDTSLEYRMKVFMHDMLVSTKMIYPNNFNNDNVITLNIPTSVGVKFLLFYNDGKPITDGTLELYSHNDNLIRSSNTDSKGQTLRFWISPTQTENNYYVPVVSLNEQIQYTHQNVRLISGSTDIEIKTPWPSSVDFLHITAKKDKVTKMTSWNDAFQARLSNEKFEQTAYFTKGEAHFANLPLGTFNLVVYEKNKPALVWANQTISLTSNSNNLDVIVSDPNPTETVSTLKQTTMDNSNSSTNLELTFLPQTSSGTQEYDSSQPYLKLVTDGDNSPVFTRSSVIEHDLSSNFITAEISIDNPKNVEEMWFSFTSDSFESGWYTFSVPSNLISSEPSKITITPNDLEQNGSQDISSIDRMQIRIRDDGTVPVTFELHNLDFGKNPDNIQGCNCVAFRLDDIQDFFLTDIQMELVNTFQQNNIDLTIGVIANDIGRDIEITEFVTKLADDPNIEFANHGYDHEDFSQFDSVGQEMLLLRANDKLSKMFGVTPTVFIPPLNAYNTDTIAALKSQGFTHFSSELDFATPPFPLSDQVLYHFPETAFTGGLNDERTRFVGKSADFTFNQVQDS